MIKSGIFIIEDYIELGNRFLQITGESMGIHANQEMVIGGIVVRVVKIILCNKMWLKNYYFEPIVNFLYSVPPPVPVSIKRYSDNEDDDIFCGCIIF